MDGVSPCYLRITTLNTRYDGCASRKVHWRIHNRFCQPGYHPTKYQGRRIERIRTWRDRVPKRSSVPCTSARRWDDRITITIHRGKPDIPIQPRNRASTDKIRAKKLQKQRPEEFQSALDKFAKNINIKHPRFIPVPHCRLYDTKGYTYWIPLFSVWQKRNLALYSTLQPKIMLYASMIPL